MMRSTCRLLLLLLPSPLFAQEANLAALDYFEGKVRPLLTARCVSCHGPNKQEAGLRLDRRASALAEHDFGRAIVPAMPQASRLLQVIRYDEHDIQMPPDGPLPMSSVRLLETWIRSGAAWTPETEALEETHAGAGQRPWQRHWAFQPIVRPAVPEVRDTAWPATPVDRFVLAQLEAHQLRPAQAADCRTLVRRAWFDLVGLPPTAADVAALQRDASDLAWTTLVDGLLASEHFGERWARYWMDVARYSDTTGYLFQQQRQLGDAWKYRDWLIAAFNRDMPIDDFMIHQIAVDKVLPADSGDKLAATGFLTLGRRFLNNKDDIIDDRIDVITRGMMAMTVTCARCHDHKYDPIPSEDYYSLYGVLASSHEPDRERSTVRLADLSRPFDPYVFVRGQPHNRGASVPRQFLAALAPDRQPFQDGSGRRELAEAIASDDNPLTARVFVNRVWGHLLGRHLVDTPSDFGLRSDPPTHPQLLDYLAASFIESGWSLKQLIREIMLSRVYRQSSCGRSVSGDPENGWLARMNRRRMDFEAHRDALLTVSGRLDRTMGGPSLDIAKAPHSTRRTVYAYIDRQNLPGVFRAFDFASPDTHAPQRFQTTVPQQALFLMNHPFVMDSAAALAGRTRAIADPAERVRRLFRLAHAREPTRAERVASRAFATRPSEAESLDTWTQLAQVLLLSNDFTFID